MSTIQRFREVPALVRALAAGCAVAGALLAATAQAAPVYVNDFEGAPDMSGWSHTTRTTDNNGETVLGVFPTKSGSVAGLSWGATGPVTFTLPGLAPGHYEVSFDLFLILSWDGHGGCCQPDFFRFSVNGTPFVDATFSNNPGSNQHQGYSPLTPLARNTVDNTPATGNSGFNVLDITPFAGSPAGARVANYRYSMLFDFTHGGGDLVLEFLGQTTPAAGDQCTVFWCGLNYYDEPWALDNLRIDDLSRPATASVPEPASLALLVPGLAVIAARRRAAAG
ncbi:PEP-CTERM sorting domain-containing protein [Inmirania thermothiophila]|uniref:Putative secreted protein with PEP-CTERM sorting signal n=1 Tax=Inmirania thermothiophila TaxID=1750597 RepID=A0A3N1XSM9_9GAMM|nr:PEP-CTERM sorting domain-containing protein [Inmirania thermothiophila]ROR29656.1 putative secreted protein with PEP-CTERM sorting signal [Inmirania thermothiophila]